MYSQNDEEAHILKHLGDRAPGRLLDIGANDGRYLSNSLALIERGWGGVLVEPNPSAFVALAKRHLKNPDVTLVNAAVTTCFPGLTEFWIATADGGRSDPTGALSTTLPAQREARAQSGQFLRPVWIPAITLADLLTMFQAPYDFLSIDTEGSSAELFQAWPFEQHRPQVVCVEHDANINAIVARATRFNYLAVTWNAENVVLVLEK